jgi:hypothetical protein
MKRIIPVILLITCMISCKKEKYSTEGPTDIRVKNISSETFSEVTVNTSGGINTMGTVNAGAFSDYFRFYKAYPKAEITAGIGGISYITGPVDYTYMVILGQGKFTYVVRIRSDNPPMLEITEVIPEAPPD